ncbi:hypothetical protein HDU96_000129 [Phlyctochytrium bullatum]|nr:hypothetical protein HDU96_000129 [Phlyctochytrium bullatum]
MTTLTESILRKVSELRRECGTRHNALLDAVDAELAVASNTARMLTARLEDALADGGGWCGMVEVVKTDAGYGDRGTPGTVKVEGVGDGDGCVGATLSVSQESEEVTSSPTLLPSASSTPVTPRKPLSGSPASLPLPTPARSVCDNTEIDLVVATKESPPDPASIAAELADVESAIKNITARRLALRARFLRDLRRLDGLEAQLMRTSRAYENERRGELEKMAGDTAGTGAGKRKRLGEGDGEGTGKRLKAIAVGVGVAAAAAAAAGWWVCASTGMF